jgi:hypothetical protein
MSKPPYEHADIRKNPDLQEWFCAKCGATSDHMLKEDAVVELSGFECNLHGATTKKLIEKERDLRAYHLRKLSDVSPKETKG